MADACVYVAPTLMRKRRQVDRGCGVDQVVFVCSDTLPKSHSREMLRSKALDEIRAGESRRIASEGGVPVLKKSRWLLLKREQNL